MIEAVGEFFRRREYEYSLHAFDQSILRRISTREIEEAVENGEYPSASSRDPERTGAVDELAPSGATR